MIAADQPIPPGVPGYDPSVRRAALRPTRRRSSTCARPATRTTRRPDAAAGPTPIVYTVSDQGCTSTRRSSCSRISRRSACASSSAWSAGRRSSRSAPAQDGAAMSPQGLGDGLPRPEQLLRPALHDGAISRGVVRTTPPFTRTPGSTISSRARTGEIDESRRYAIYREATRSSCDDAPWAFTFGVHHFYVRQPYVRGFAPHPVWGLDVEPRLGSIAPPARSSACSAEGCGLRRLARRLAVERLRRVGGRVDRLRREPLRAGRPGALVAGAQARPADVARIREQLGLDRPACSCSTRVFWKRLRPPRPGARRPGDRPGARELRRRPAARRGGRAPRSRQELPDAPAGRRSRRDAAAAHARARARRRLGQLLLGVGTGVLAAVRRGSWVDRLLVGDEPPRHQRADVPHRPPAAVRPRARASLAAARRLRERRSASTRAASCSRADARRLRRGVLHAPRARRDGRAPRRRLGAHGARQGLSRHGGRDARHALRNALVPIVTSVGLDFGALMGGAIVTETVFRWPGLGRAQREGRCSIATGPVILAASS